MQSQNPFTPTFGIVPPYLAGRRDVLAEYEYAFDRGIGDPNLSSLLIGARGTGKTALLAALANKAESAGWISVRVIAEQNILQEILAQSLRVARKFIDPPQGQKLKGFSIGSMVSVEWDNAPLPQTTWRTTMEDLLDQLGEKEIGLLITVDEVKIDIPEMKQLVNAYQLLIGEGYKVGLIMAGLPHNVSLMLADGDVSFVRRARQRRLDRISDYDIREAFIRTIEEAGKEITPDALDIIVRASAGFAYMMQLVGYRAWEESRTKPQIDAESATRGARLAGEEMQHTILESTYRDLSNGDVRFLIAMLEDEGDSRLAHVAERMGVGSNYASQYKKRLLEQGIIGERGRGYVGFDMPMFKEFLKHELEVRPL